MKRILSQLAVGLIMAAAIGSVLAPTSARAFCVVNQTDDPILFTAQPHPPETAAGPFPYAVTVGPGARACHRWPAATRQLRTIVYAFENDEALEGCAYEISPTETLHLLTLEEFDRCAWSTGPR